MSETEGICDDCEEAMIDKGNDIWYCPNCELYLEWHEVGDFYVYLDDDEALEIINKDTTQVIFMKIWILRPNQNLPEEDNPWNPWFDKCFGMIIQAETETSARHIADANGEDETRDGHDNFTNTNISNHPWLNKRYSTCQELIATEDEKVILKDIQQA